MVVSVKNLYNLETAMFFNATSLTKIKKSWTTDFRNNDTFEIVVNFPEKLFLLIWSDDRYKYSAFALSATYTNVDADKEPLKVANKEYNRRKDAILEE